MKELQFYSSSLVNSKKHLPLFAYSVSAGFPSPATDYEEKRLNLHEYVVENEATTFFVKASGESIIGVGIFDGTMLVVDKSVEAQDGDIVVAFLDGECLVKRMRHENGKLFLCAENKGYPNFDVTRHENFQVFGVVLAWCHKIKTKKL